MADNFQRLDQTAMLAKWKSLSPLEKAKYQKMYIAEKEELGDMYRSDIKKLKMKPEEAKKKKRTKDCLRQKNLREVLAKQKIQEKSSFARLKNIIRKKTERICEMNSLTETLNSELLSYEIETTAVVKQIQEKKEAETLMKKKYKLAFSHHSGCNKL